MSITQTNRPKRSHVFFLKLALGVFVLIFAAMIFLNHMKAKGIAADRITVDYKGDTVQPYNTPEENRVSVCIAE